MSYQFQHAQKITEEHWPIILDWMSKFHPLELSKQHDQMLYYAQFLELESMEPNHYD